MVKSLGFLLFVDIHYLGLIVKMTKKQNMLKRRKFGARKIHEWLCLLTTSQDELSSTSVWTLPASIDQLKEYYDGRISNPELQKFRGIQDSSDYIVVKAFLYWNVEKSNVKF